MDPDTDRTPVEQIALDRLKHGGLRSENLLDDALTIAMAETGVPVIALDPDRIDGDPACGSPRRASRSAGAPLSARQIVIADGSGPLASCWARCRPTRA